ncbi:MAG: hypothetical protein ACUVTL_05345 [Thermoproteota archaeon]
MAHGGYLFKVEYPRLFITELAGKKVHLSSYEVKNFIRGYLSETLIDSSIVERSCNNLRK